MSELRASSARYSLIAATLALAAIGIACAAGPSEEWPSWRGPRETGESSAVGLVSDWSVDGDNLIWHQPFVGRSTPVVFDGRVCANARAGSGHEDMRATVACWNAGDGALLWQHDFNVYNTTVPFTRVGWASVIGDPETGYLYYHEVDGRLVTFDADGEIVWEWRLHEDTGRASGYGGRTQSPVLDGDQLILSNMGANWGEHATPRHRFWSFDKRTGQVRWVSLPGNRPWSDANTQGTPVVAEVGGRRLLIGGGADGWVYAVDVGTGAPVWEFQLSKVGINVTPVVAGELVYIAHSEENIDNAVMGRVVAINGAGSGNVTDTHEAWRADGLGIGFSSPLYHDGVLYVVDNASNLIALDAQNGNQLWQVEVGTVGKSSPVWADGKIYYTEVNGRVYILQLTADGAEIIDVEEVDMPNQPEGLERHAEIYGSPAIAYGRIYISTEAGIFCIGDPSASYSGAGIPIDYGVPAGSGTPARLQVVPAEVIATSGEEIDFEVHGYDASGRPLGVQQDASWLIENLTGVIDDRGVFRPAEGVNQAGKIIAQVGDLTAAARVRAFGPLPWSFDFESGSKPPQWMGGGPYRPAERDGGHVLQKSPSPEGLHRHVVYLGPDAMSGYTIEADIMGSRERRRLPELGLINGGYTLDLQGNYQRLELRAWASELRLTKVLPDAAHVPFEWTEDTWYTMKLRVDVQADHTLIRGKVWQRDAEEPAEWTLTVQDPLRIAHGAPGLYGHSTVDIFFDNLRVYTNE
jgi:outer membrane protein assembly factor BamB